MPTVSILMPSLNVAAYIEECLDSVLGQTLQDLEVICIDAGSTDGTLEYLQEAQRRDERVRLVVSDRKSYGYQMNLGLDAATGEYIGIVETDDWVEPQMFERLYTTAKAQDADLVKCNYYWHYTKPERKDTPFENLAKCPYDTPFKPLEERELFMRAPAIWSGIYRTKMLADHGIRFNETPGASYQDASFHFMVCTIAERAYLIADHLHHYRRDNEASSVNSTDKMLCVCDEMHYFESFLDDHPDIKAVLEPYYVALKYDKYRWNYDRLSPELQWEFLKTFHAEFRQHHAAGLVQRRFYNKGTWGRVRLVATNPIQYFEDTCKRYATRPTGDELPAAEVLLTAEVDDPDVSIIMPLCNLENYVEGSLASATGQTHRNIEVICVDDGSTDATLELVLRAAQQDHRIAVLHQVHEGLSAARNHALEVARGCYILFLDGDDLLLPQAVAYLLDTVRAQDADVLYFDGMTRYLSSSLRDAYPHLADAYRYDRTWQEPVSGQRYLTEAHADGKYRVNAYLGIYRRAFLESCHIRFVDGIFHEDNAFSYLVAQHAQRVSHVAEALYIRCVRENSIITAPKTLPHLYGLLSCIRQAQTLAASVPYDEAFDREIASELRDLSALLDATHAKLKDRKRRVAQLTDAERVQLDVLLGYHASKRDKRLLDEAAQRERDIVGSVSFRVGRKLTAPLRLARDSVRSAREQGISETLAAVTGRSTSDDTIEPKALFVSSDSYRMSGAFLSEVALNHLLNSAFDEQTHVILPYRGSGIPILKAAKVAHSIIESKDWIVPIGTPHDELHELEKAIEHIGNRKAAAAIARYALDHGFNVIHSNTSYTYVGALAAKLAGLPHIWHIREHLEEGQNNQYYNEEQAHELLNEATRLVAISRAVESRYASIVDGERLRVIYNGIDAERFSCEEHRILTGDRPVLLFVSGSSSPLKGRFDLVDACALLQARGIDFDLWFVGWCGTELQRAVRDKGLTARTTFFGYQRDTERFYRSADIFFMCSRFEAFGRTTVEAGMGGCLVVGSNVAGTPELIDDGQTGYLYEYGDAVGLAAVIESALADPAGSQAIARAGQRHFLEHFAAVTNARAIHDLHVEVVRDWQQPSARDLKRAYARIEAEERACEELERTRTELQARLDELRAQGIPQDEVPKEDARPVDAESEETLSADAPKVSVIVPIYNVEAYLRQCLDSIAAQTLPDIEVVCVNDGSTDSSPDIIREYAAKDNRFVLVDKENGGYGAAVNRGFALAHGRYLAIVEPDDFIAPNMYEDLYDIARTRGFVDIVKGSYWQYFDTEDGAGRLVDAPISSACKPYRPVFEVWDYPEIIYHHPSIWSCLYRRDFIVEEGIGFVEAPGAGWVDNPFLVESFCRAQTIAWTPEHYYYYRQTNPNASSHIRDCSLPFRRTSEMLAFLDANGIYDDAVRRSVYKRILYNADAALANPNYDPAKDDALIVAQIREVDPRFLKVARVKPSERAAYRHFMSRRV